MPAQVAALDVPPELVLWRRFAATTAVRRTSYSGPSTSVVGGLSVRRRPFTATGY